MVTPSKPQRLYLDHNATTPVLPEVVEAMARAMETRYANPSSLHESGRSGRALLEDCRERMARHLGARPSEIVFTSGGTEGNQLAVLSTFDLHTEGGGGAAEEKGRPHAVVSRIEHPSTLGVYRSLEKKGSLTVTWIPSRGDGTVDPMAIREALTEQTVLVSLLHANNETGVLQDVQSAGKICRSRGILFHCDAVQSLGKVSLSVRDLEADLVTFSSHKVYGPKGVGALWIRDGVRVRHPWGGGPQERERRPGTENLPGVVGFACALDHVRLPPPDPRDRLWWHVRAGCPNAVLNGSLDRTVPNTLNVSFLGIQAEILLIRLDMEGIHASTGSACASGAREPSHVLEAMGLPPERIASAVRFSLGRGITDEDVERASEVIVRSVEELRDRGDRGS